jgi:hypothetical protein
MFLENRVKKDIERGDFSVPANITAHLPTEASAILEDTHGFPNGFALRRYILLNPYSSLVGLADIVWRGSQHQLGH